MRVFYTTARAHILFFFFDKTFLAFQWVRGEIDNISNESRVWHAGYKLI